MEKKIIITRLQPRFETIVRKYMEKHGLTQQQMGDKVGIKRPHLNALLMGARPLSAYYVFKFIYRGIFNVSDIYDGNAESDKETDFWATAKESENYELLRTISRLRRNGIDIDNIIKALDNKK